MVRTIGMSARMQHIYEDCEFYNDIATAAAFYGHSLYQNYDVMYLPTQGENFGHAILESFMNSRPVIISNKTPWLNLEKENVGWDLSLDERNFSTIIDKAADMDSHDYQMMIDDVRRYVSAYFDGAGKASMDKHIKMFTI